MTSIWTPGTYILLYLINSPEPRVVALYAFGPTGISSCHVMTLRAKAVYMRQACQAGARIHCQKGPRTLEGEELNHNSPFE